MTPVLELLNPGDTTTTALVTLFSQEGAAGGQVTVTLAAKTEQDVILSTLSGFRSDAYGLVQVDFCGGSIDGRTTYYRQSSSGSSYEFAYSIPFTAPLYGSRHI